MNTAPGNSGDVLMVVGGLATLAKAHWLPPPYPASSRRRLRAFAAEHGVS